MSRRIMAALVVLMASATGQADDFRVLADHSVDYPNISTFRIERVSIIRNHGDVSQASLDSLREVVRDYLLHEGLRESKAAADILVTVTAGVEVGLENREAQGIPYLEGNQWIILPREEKETDPVTPPRSARYGEGSLQIEIRDKGNRVIWRADIRDVVNLPLSRHDLARALDQVFSYYPPAPK